MQFEPVDSQITLTKVQAATRQIQFAIGAMLAGNYDAAITLSGAAEGMLVGDPEIEVSRTFINNTASHQKMASILADNGRAPPSIDSKDAIAKGRPLWIEVINVERNWLKHKTENLPGSINLDLDNTAIYIFRAMRNLPPAAITEEMVAFEDWYRKRISDTKGRKHSPPFTW